MALQTKYLKDYKGAPYLGYTDLPLMCKANCGDMQEAEARKLLADVMCVLFLDHR